MKCALVGDSESGKSTLLQAYALPSAPLSPRYSPTIVEKYRVNIEQAEVNLAIEFWDIGENT